MTPLANQATGLRLPGDEGHSSATCGGSAAHKRADPAQENGGGQASQAALLEAGESAGRHKQAKLLPSSDLARAQQPRQQVLLVRLRLAHQMLRDDALPADRLHGEAESGRNRGGLEVDAAGGARALW